MVWGVLKRLWRLYLLSLRDGVLNTVVASPWVPDKVRVRLLRVAGAKGVATSAMLRSGATYIGSATRLSIGERTFINYGCVLDLRATITIGTRVAIGPGVMLLTSSHTMGSSEYRAQNSAYAPVSIGDGAWLGARSTVLPGVTIGRGAVVAAGAVVTSDCDPDCLYAGVPAQMKRRLPSADPSA